MTAARLRDMVFDTEPDALVGSLQDLAKALDVGIVTIQQAARVLEHEGLLEVRRGPGGGYYGRRPNMAAVERSIAAYLRSNPTSFEEALNITSLLFNELVVAAADCQDTILKSELELILRRLDSCCDSETRAIFESDFQSLLFKMVDWPLFKLLTVVTLHVGIIRPSHILGEGADMIAEWRSGRRRIITAILSGDQELARFEADRSNRQHVLRGIGKRGL